MATDKYEAKFPSEIYRVKQIILDVLNFIKSSMPKVTDEDMFEIRLIFTELLCNAIIHGNKQDICKYVRICIEINHDGIRSKIVDEGLGFDYMRLLSGINDINNLDCEHGRGIRLVYSLTDSLTFNTIGNEIKFYKRVFGE